MNFKIIKDMIIPVSLALVTTWLIQQYVFKQGSIQPAPNFLMPKALGVRVFHQLRRRGGI